MVRNVIGQGAGFLAMALAFLIFQQKERKKAIAIKWLCDVLWVVHFALIGAYTGMAISLVGCVREIVFFGGKEKEGRGRVYLFVFLLLGIGGVLLTWKNAFCVFPLIATVLSTLAFWQQKPERMKMFSFGVSVMQMIYAIRFSSYAAILNETVVMTSILIYFLRAWHRRAQKPVYATR